MSTRDEMIEREEKKKIVDKDGISQYGKAREERDREGGRETAR